MSEDMDKIFEISLNKIEHSKSRNVCGKSSMLHRTLLVNSVINRVRNTDRTPVNNEQEMPLMNYREPRSLDDMDDYESEKTLIFTGCQSRCINQVNNTSTQRRKISSLVAKLNSRSLCGKLNEPLVTKHRVDVVEGKENIVNMECNKRSNDIRRSNHSQKRLYCSSNNTDFDEQPCPKKKLRCIWPNNIGQDLNFSITGLASLFGDLVASSDAEKSNITINGNFATAMVAC